MHRDMMTYCNKLVMSPTCIDYVWYVFSY